MKHENRLIHSSSPYLIQHAHNPVDWWEWCDEAFEKARQEDKLVLVSIGYSACHWCHVMAHECFEDEATAAIMNDRFICIKVDREERPDIDQIYMDAVQLLTGSGGWPLNCFTLPDGRPIHGGTYFPRKNWQDNLFGLSDFYRNNKEEAFTYATNLTGGIRQINQIESGSGNKIPDNAEIDSILEKWSESFDLIEGGFNWSPKFPMPTNLQLFMDYRYYTGKDKFQKHVDLTLHKMADGGIFDQIGGGFARYSTDAKWIVPHFEKMLYDNAQLMSLYARAFLTNKDQLYLDVIESTHRFLKEELRSPDGLYYSAYDADSEGVEGKFYIWSKVELKKLLGENEELFSAYYSVETEGNWEHGENILYRKETDEALESASGKNISEIKEIIRKCNAVLLKERSKRVWPSLDDKVITSWNALMIKGYADCYKATGNKLYLDSARQCCDKILELLYQDGVLYRIFKDGKVSIRGFSEDYSSFCEALLCVYEVTGHEKYALHARELMELSISGFYDRDKKMFCFRDKHGKQLISEKFDTSDDVIPSSNSIFAKCLLKLGYLFDSNLYHEMADDMLSQISPKIEKYPTMYGNWLQLILWKNHGFYQLVESGTDQLTFQEKYIPNLMNLHVDGKTEIPLLREKTTVGMGAYYLCRDKVCNLPVASMPEVYRLLDQR